MRLVLLGPPGAGKGTQAALMCRRLGLLHISTGDMLRQELQAKTELGLKAHAYIEKGELVPDSIILDMVRAKLEEPECENGYILDGFPRTLVQADALAQFVELDAVIYLEVPFEIIIKRISGRRRCPKCGVIYHTSHYEKSTCSCGGVLYQREDDKLETVKNRLAVYEAETRPLIAYYSQKGLLRTVDGEGTPEEVDARIAALLEP
ncbi:MAG TPA: adenylate kinase [Clostridia bacterium]|nr:adenylate kinase [Clostridia bacterium]